MAPKKLRYESRSIEHHVDRPRDEVWPVVLAMVRASGPASELSVEPPWRIACEMPTDDVALGFWQSTVLIRDDGPTCHVAWSLVFDPDPGAAAMAAAEAILVDMRRRLRALAETGG